MTGALRCLPMPLDFDQIIAGHRDRCPPTLNTNQVADMLGSTAEVVRSRVKRGEIPAYWWGGTCGSSGTKCCTGFDSRRSSHLRHGRAR